MSKALSKLLVVPVKQCLDTGIYTNDYDINGCGYEIPPSVVVVVFSEIHNPQSVFGW